MNIHNTEIEAEDDERRRYGDPSASDLAIPLEQRVKVDGLRDGVCHWPVGDPRDANFFFCGGRTLEGEPYCAHHHRVGVAPPQDRRRKS